MDKTKLFGIKIEKISGDELQIEIKKFLLGKSKVKIAKVNSEFLLRAIKNKEFKDALNSFDMNFSDGIGVLWAAKYLSIPVVKNKLLRFAQAIWQMIYSGASLVFNPKFCRYPIPENIPGVDALMLMLKVASETKSGVFFFGATRGDLDSSIKGIKKRIPTLKVSGSMNGYDFQKMSSISPVDEINKTEAKLLIVALGSPLQEYWIQNNMEKLTSIRVAVGEGGSLAFLGGTFKRAPKWMEKIGLEWLWRLFVNKSLTHQTGSRLKRVWNAVPVFIYEVVKWKLKYGATKDK
jgi:N-acetylglucosaminyldiphosphoundecaprenol N-acetyl-beta-D-mannosaminyltransferase